MQRQPTAFPNPLNGFGSAPLSLRTVWNEALSEGTLQHEALYCRSRLVLIKENEPGDFGKTCLIKKKSTLH